MGLDFSVCVYKYYHAIHCEYIPPFSPQNNAEMIIQFTQRLCKSKTGPTFPHLCKMANRKKKFPQTKRNMWSLLICIGARSQMLPNT